MSSLAGRILGKYQLAECMAHGGMAEVYKAFQPGIERTVVIKVLYRHLAGSADLIARFQREARVIGSLHNPHIVRIIDIDTEGGLYYMVMDYIRGGTLGDRLKETSPLPIADALRIAAQLAYALACTHEKGIIHRDIKPTNIMFVDDTLNHAVLTDYGLAHLCEDTTTGLTIPGAMIGTPTYMSPEAIRGEKCEGNADIYSLGVVLYEMLTGKPPYEANTPYRMMTKLVNEPLASPRTLNPDLPIAVEEILLKALEKDPADRYQNAVEFADAIRRVFSELPGVADLGPERFITPLPTVPTPIPTPAPVASKPIPGTAASVPVGRVAALLLGASGVLAVAALTIQLLLRL